MSEKESIFSKLESEDTETLLNYRIAEEDILVYKDLYEEQMHNGDIDPDIKFRYAWCLVHGDADHVKRALPLLQDLFQHGSEQMKRDTLFYLALGNVKIKEYYTAKKYIVAFLSIEPTNEQVKQLHSFVKIHLVKDGVKGMAITGAVAVAGGLAAIAIGGIVLTTGIGTAIVGAIRARKK